MPQYFVSLKHSSDQCPTSNAKLRDRMVKAAPEIPKIAQKMGIKFVAGPLVLGGEHKSVAVVEADRIETVQDFLVHTGLVQWNSITVSTVQTMEESMKDLEKLPPTLY